VQGARALDALLCELTQCDDEFVVVIVEELIGDDRAVATFDLVVETFA
jgi:hypothetical protein